MDADLYYTVELARPAHGWRSVEHLTTKARKAAEDLSREGVPVDYLRSVFVPEDDVCFFIYRGPSADDVRRAVERAGLATGPVSAALREGQTG